MLLLFVGNRKKKISVFAVLRVLGQQRVEVFNCFLVMFKMEGTNSQKVLSLFAGWVSLSAIRKDSQTSFKLIVLHEFFPLKDGLISNSVSSHLFPTVFQDRIVSC